VASHLSDLDPLVLAACLSYRMLRRTWWGGEASRLFRGRLRSALAHAVNVFPVDERTPHTSLALALAILERGEFLVWFPESWRSPDGRIQQFLPGIGFLVARSGAPCVPVRIAGTFEAMPRTARLPRPHRVRVTFGRAVSARRLSADSPAAGRERAIADALRDAVARLGP